jgi:hypothetical protein
MDAKWLYIKVLCFGPLNLLLKMTATVHSYDIHKLTRLFSKVSRMKWWQMSIFFVQLWNTQLHGNMSPLIITVQHNCLFVSKPSKKPLMQIVSLAVLANTVYSVSVLNTTTVGCSFSSQTITASIFDQCWVRRFVVCLICPVYIYIPFSVQCAL